MTSKILVPLDIEAEKTGGESLEYAKQLAKDNDAKIVLLHVKETIPGYVSTYLPADFAKTATDTAQGHLAAAAKSHGLDGSVEIVMRDGNAAAEILDYAKDNGVDMIVIASHDPGLADYLLGSTAARVVRHAHCSVLVIRHPK
jgi:universal stress protein F